MDLDNANMALEGESPITDSATRRVTRGRRASIRELCRGHAGIGTRVRMHSTMVLRMGPIWDPFQTPDPKSGGPDLQI